VASNEVGGLFPEIRQALYTARIRAGRADAFLPADALRLATLGGARCIGRPELGRLEVGAVADLAVWPADDLDDLPEPLDGLALGPDRRVRHLVVDGSVVLGPDAWGPLDVAR
jgi:cytosine/adenosine deaminase-related metal-dependent hydrolase